MSTYQELVNEYKEKGFYTVEIAGLKLGVGGGYLWHILETYGITKIKGIHIVVADSFKDIFTTVEIKEDNRVVEHLILVPEKTLRFLENLIETHSTRYK